MDRADQRPLDITIAINADRFIGELIQFRPGNLNLIVGSQRVSGAHLAVTVHQRLIRPLHCSFLPGGTHSQEEECYTDPGDSRDPHHSLLACHEFAVNQVAPELSEFVTDLTVCGTCVTLSSAFTLVGKNVRAAICW